MQDDRHSLGMHRANGMGRRIAVIAACEEREDGDPVSWPTDSREGKYRLRGQRKPIGTLLTSLGVRCPVSAVSRKSSILHPGMNQFE